MARLEFFFDCSSPWTYLAFHRIEDVCRETGAELIWRPILVGGVFNAVNSSVYEQRAKPVPAKARYYAKDLRDWARSYGLRIGQPPVFPVNSVKAMRGAFFALERGVLPAYARAVFETYWGDLRTSRRTRSCIRSCAGGLPVDEFAGSPRQSTRRACATTPTS
jgi:2-hydroxychromene-2-carboxylate isomerase